VATSPASLEFGQFQIIADRRELLAGGRVVELGAREFDLLLVLVEARGSLVSKDELMMRVWPGRVVEEGNLQTAIWALRKAFGGQRDLIRTVAGRGYQFTGQIRQRAEPNYKPGWTSNLPASASELIGRETALAEVVSLVLEHRFVTLAGAGGMGKTRLAIEAARELLSHFADGVWFADLAPLTDPEVVPATVAMALTPILGEIPPTMLSSAVEAKQFLLVLDNCEHVIGVAARTADELIRAGAKVRILCTSREPLQAEGEWVYQVQPLDVSPEDAGPPENALNTGAARLFVRRAAAAHPGFKPTPEIAATIAAICRRLDGMPLAIEFAAARAAVLGVDEVARRLDNRFRLLSGGKRTALARHQTLRATLDWSYELLEEVDRQAMCRLAIFVSGFTFGAACSVLSDQAHTGPDGAARVASLVAKSVLAIEARGATVRYRMLETTRAYALEKLVQRGELQQISLRHAEYYLLLFNKAMEKWRTGEDRVLSADTCSFIDDARAALDWGFSPGGDATLAAELTITLAPLWMQLALMDEQLKRAEQALRAIGKDDSLRAMKLTALRADALMYTRGFDREGEANWNEVLNKARQLDDREYQLAALFELYARFTARGDFRSSVKIADRFLELAKTGNVTSQQNQGDTMMAFVRLFMGEHAKAKRHVDAIAGRGISRRYRLPFVYYTDESAYRFLLALILWFQGFAEQALQAVKERLDSVADKTILRADTLAVLSCQIALLTGDYLEVERCLSLLREVSLSLGLFHRTWIRCIDAKLCILRGDAERGVPVLRAALFDLNQKQVNCWQTFVIGALAEGLGNLGQFDDALTVIDKELAFADNSGIQLHTPEHLRIKGELILSRDAPGKLMAAEVCFAQAIELAATQGALSWELRAATSLARLRLRQGREQEAIAVLKPVYDRFSEGFETADLRAARSILDGLSSSR
jgi:predicted ATPase/DNA-binding winged helix-turn-helix (wHTH) protein